MQKIPYCLPLATLSMTLLALTGCAVGPDFVVPPAPLLTRYTAQPLPDMTLSAAVPGGEAQRFEPGQEIPRQWWTLFHSRPLNAVIEQALAHNPTLQAAQAALRAAQENVAVQQGAYYPGVSANFNPSRQKTAIGSVTSSAASGDSIYNVHTAQVSVSYAIDVFGANRRQVESLQAQAAFQRYQLEAAKLSLTANVVLTVVQEASLRGQIAATIDIINLQREQLDLLRQQFKSGAIGEALVVAQEAALAQTKAQLPPLKKQLEQQRNALAMLAGRLPSDAISETFALSTLTLPHNLPISLPSNLVSQRPDVRAAEAQLHSASALIGVARANMLPQLTLSASGGSMATAVGDLFKSGNAFWNLAGGLTQPLFDGGALLHRKNAAEAGFDQAAAQYRATVIAAFQNVADALQALHNDAEALQEAVAAEQASASSVAITRQQVALGDISYFASLPMEQNYKQAVMNVVQAQANRYADTAALFLALGGGWTSGLGNAGQDGAAASRSQ